MGPRRAGVLLAAAVLVLGYAYRAFVGVRAGTALIDADRDERSLWGVERLRRADVGFNRLVALEGAAWALTKVWEDQARQGTPAAADPRLLAEAQRIYLEGLCMSPASREWWEGLSQVYHLREHSSREERAAGQWIEGASPWSRVGLPGRIAIGMIRIGIERAPNWYGVYDDLAEKLWRYGLRREAAEAVRQSARVLPVYQWHVYSFKEDLPDWVIPEFLEGARETVGQLPQLSARKHLIEIGKLELTVQENDRAVASLRAALERSGDEVSEAEAEFHMAIALQALGQRDEARSLFEQTSEHPSFRESSLVSLAELAEEAGDFPSALNLFRRLRREQPDDIGYALSLARVARRLELLPVAIEALKTARLRYPDDLTVCQAMFDTYVDMGDSTSAMSLRAELERLRGAAAREAEALADEQARERERWRRLMEQAPRGTGRTSGS